MFIKRQWACFCLRHIGSETPNPPFFHTACWCISYKVCGPVWSQLRYRKIAAHAQYVQQPWRWSYMKQIWILCKETLFTGEGGVTTRVSSLIQEISGNFPLFRFHFNHLCKHLFSVVPKKTEFSNSQPKPPLPCNTILCLVVCSHVKFGGRPGPYCPY